MNQPQYESSTNRRWPASMGWGAALLLVIAAWAVAFVLRGGSGEKVVIEGWVDGLEAGQAQAAEADQPMVVLFTAGWCGPCQNLKHDVLSRPEVVEALQADFVPVQIDLTDRSSANPNLQVAQRYGVGGIPTIIAMSPDGETIARYDGGRSVESFTGWLEAIEYTPSQHAGR